MLSTTVRTPARLVLPLSLFIAAPSLSAQEPTQVTSATGEQREHIVRKGDTLWDLARVYLGNPFLWPSIFDANRTVVRDPHWIYPLERLLIPPVAARDAVEHVGTPVPRDAPATPVAVPMPSPIAERVGLPAANPPVEVEADVVSLDLRRQIVPVSEYRSAPWVSATAEGDVIGRVVALRDPAERDTRMAPMLHSQQLVYVGALRGATPAVGDSLLIVRFGGVVDGRGRVVEPLGILRVLSVDGGGTVTARLARYFGEARVGDAVMWMEAVPAIGFGTPEPVMNGAQGRLLRFLHSEPLHGTTDIAFLSLGPTEVGIGDEVTVYVPGETVSVGGAQTLPTAAIATMRIVKVADNVATARVLTVNSAALRDGLPVRVTRRMQ